MHIARAMRLLSLPAAIVFGTSAVGCSSGGPTAPDQDPAAPSFAVTKGPLDDELNPPDKKPCPGGYELVNDPESPYDVNGNGFVCEKKGGPGPRK
jgi:hypothetical protein